MARTKRKRSQSPEPEPGGDHPGTQRPASKKVSLDEEPSGSLSELSKSPSVDENGQTSTQRLSSQQASFAEGSSGLSELSQLDSLDDSAYDPADDEKLLSQESAKEDEGLQLAEESDDLGDDDEEAKKDDGHTKYKRKISFVDSEDFSQEGVATLKKQTSRAIHNNRNLGFVRKVEKALEEIQAKHVRMPKDKKKAAHSTIRAMFETPPKDGKERYKPRFKKNGKLYLQKFQTKATIFLEDDNGDFFKFSVEGTQSPIEFATNYDNCVRLAKALAKFMNAWPEAPLFGSLGNTRALSFMVAQAAFNYLAPDYVRVKAPTWSKDKGFASSIQYWDTEACESKIYRRVSYNGIKLDIHLPDLPSNVQLYLPKENSRGTLIDRNPDGTLPSLLPSDRDVLKDPVFSNRRYRTESPNTLDEVKAREKFERFLSWKLEGTMMSRKQMDDLIREYEIIYLEAKHSRNNKFRGGQQLLRLTIDREGRGMKLEPYHTIRENLGGAKLPWLRLRNINYAWAQPVIEGARRKWRETSDAAATWLEVAALVDLANEELMMGNPPLERCYCVEGMRNDITHLCENCGSEVPCATRQRNVWGLFVCVKCQGLETQLEPMNEMIIARSLRRQFQQEASDLGLPFDSPQIQEVMNEAAAFLKKQMGTCAPTEFKDTYADSIKTIPNTYNPLTPSLDAVDPFTCRTGPGGTLQTWTHAAPNLVLTALALNIAKSHFLLASVAEIANHCAQSEGKSDEEKAALDKHLVDRLAEHRIIAIKYSIARKKRLHASFTPEEFSAAKQEFRTGLLSTGNKLDKASLLSGYVKLYHQGTSESFTEEQRHDIINICNEIEEEFGVKIPRSTIDGAPFPSMHESMPHWWNWDEFTAVIMERYRRLKFKCNRYWPTVDTPMGLACEIFFQIFGGSEEFLSLPMCCAVRSPLRFSVAHKNHGQQMRTGWPSHPTSLADRKEEDNNLLVETWFSNALKNDTREKLYPVLRKYMKTLKIPKHLYESAASRPTLKTVEQDLPAEEDFDMSAEADRFCSTLVDTQGFLDAINAAADGEDDPADKPELGDGDAVIFVLNFARLKERCQDACVTAESLNIKDHREVANTMAQLLPLSLAQDPSEDEKAQFEELVKSLEDYVEAATASMIGTDDVAQSDRISTSRKQLFKNKAAVVLSIPQMAGWQPVEHFVDMINGDLPYEEDTFSVDEAKILVSEMSADSELQWNADSEEVRRN